jgi:hypothetical protein
MTEFEYFSVAVSMIMALGIGRLLDGIGPGLDPDRRYWIHFGWLIQKLLNHVLWWWGLWSANRTFDWNLAWFLWTLSGPAILYLQSAALVTRSPESIASFRDRFYQIRPWFFAGNLFLCVNLLGGRIFTGDYARLTSYGLMTLAVLALAGLLSKEERVHVLLACAALAIQILGLGAAMFEVGTY